MNIFTSTILHWYGDHKRELPWRATQNPYAIWISEIILQQTRVVQGLDYYYRFMKRFPDVHSLAAADEDEVLKYWQGLGYYSRARNLHTAAQSIVGEFPTDYASVRALKGVGDYTAAAICSFAYNLPYAVVDGNVYRVLSRYFGIDTPIDSTQGKKVFAALAQEMLPPSLSSSYNQAIMDFGALQCVPQTPRCVECPLLDSCFAALNNRISELPVKQHKTKTSNRYFNYIYVRMGAQTFLNKRTANDIWKNLFELPLVESDKMLSEEEFNSLPHFKSMLSQADQSLTARLINGPVKHVLSHRIIYANFYELILPENSTSFSSFQKIPIEKLEHYAVSKLVNSFLEKYQSKFA